MSFDNSPSNSSYFNVKSTALKQLQALSLQFLQRTKGFFETQKLPYFASRTCKIYLGEADQAQQAKCRRILRTRLELNPAQLRRFFQTSLGNALLAWFERFFHLPDSQNGVTLKDLLVQMATDPEGLSLLSLLRRSPHMIQLNIDQILVMAKQMEVLLHLADETVETIHNLSIAEAKTDPPIDFAHLIDARQLGSYAVKHYTLTLKPPPTDASNDRTIPSLSVCCYQPEPLPEGKIPVIIQSHGLASCPEDLAVSAQHLASYGYFVAALQHEGSDTQQVRNMLAGNVSEVFKWTEFVDRPASISHLLDALEQWNQEEFDHRLDVQAVGMMGYSFGTYTAFALAGADIDFESLETACEIPLQKPNMSLLLQCQALELPRQPYDFLDHRIVAILSIDSLGSELFGVQGIGKIQVPVLLIAGSHDATAPLALEQINIFQWMTSPHHYLAVIQGKTHIQDMERLANNLDLQLKLLPQNSQVSQVPLFETYINALSLTFFNQHFKRVADTLPPLNVSYGSSISYPPYELWMISQRSSQTLRQALQSLPHI